MKYILFLCVANAGRSQMASYLFDMIKTRFPVIDENYTVISAGICPTDSIGPTSSEVMRELEIEMSGRPKGLDEEMLRNAERIICLDPTVSPYLQEYPHEIWDIEDTYNKDKETIRRIRNELFGRLLLFVEELCYTKIVKLKQTYNPKL